MQRIAGNTLLLAILSVFGSYVLISLLVPSAIFAVAMSVSLMLSAALVCRRYLPTTYNIVVNRLRSREDGSHFLIFGITLLALGAIYTGVYGIAYEYYGRPVEWVGTWYSRLGQLMNISGFLCLAFSPDFSEGPPKLKNAIIVAVLFAVSVTAAFIAGNRSRDLIDDDVLRFSMIHGADRPTCGPDKPIYVSASGMIHNRFSKYRSMIIPRRCFETERQAVEAGFRLPTDTATR